MMKWIQFFKSFEKGHNSHCVDIYSPSSKLSGKQTVEAETAVQYAAEMEAYDWLVFSAIP